MAKQRIPRVTSYMLSSQPDQTSAILNTLIDAVNDLLSER